MKKLRNKPRRYRFFLGDTHTIDRRLFALCMAQLIAARDPGESNPEEASKQNQRNAEAA
jgi:hypothetical protein